MDYNNVKVYSKISEEMAEALDTINEQTGMSYAEMIRIGLELFLDDYFISGAGNESD